MVHKKLKSLGANTISNQYKSAKILDVLDFLNKYGLQRYKKRDKPIMNIVCPFQRRARDSNPRTCNSQQFSRLPQSTTLPALRCKSKVCYYKKQTSGNSDFLLNNIEGEWALMQNKWNSCFCTSYFKGIMFFKAFLSICAMTKVKAVILKAF